MNRELERAPNVTRKDLWAKLITELLPSGWQGLGAARVHPECKPQVRTGGAGSRAVGSKGNGSVLWQNARGKALFCCPIWQVGLRRLERGMEIYVGQCSKEQWLLSPQRRIKGVLFSILLLD